VSLSRALLPFDWEVKGKELEKPTEDSSTKKNPWWVYSGACYKEPAECWIKKEHNTSSLFC